MCFSTKLESKEYRGQLQLHDDKITQSRAKTFLQAYFHNHG
uniref:Uncharacterized protein n=1 Tax=Rhizophora mucronata TaxID=61149 RepID=A0A2P2P2Y2_RHIMU